MRHIYEHKIYYCSNTTYETLHHDGGVFYGNAEVAVADYDYLVETFQDISFRLCTR